MGDVGKPGLLTPEEQGLVPVRAAAHVQARLAAPSRVLAAGRGPSLPASSVFVTWLRRQR